MVTSTSIEVEQATVLELHRSSSRSWCTRVHSDSGQGSPIRCHAMIDDSYQATS